MKPILKFQQGGDTMPFVDYMPFQGLGNTGTGAAATAASASSKKEDGNAALTSITKLLDQIKGLPSDSAALASSIQNLYSEATLYNDGHLNTEDVVTMYMSNLQKLASVDFNLKQFDLAQKEVIDNGGLHEVAIDSNGRLFVQDQETGAMGRISVEGYREMNKKDPGKLVALTNNDLLFYRAQDPKQAFNNEVLGIVSNGIGEKKVTEMLLQVATGLGKETLKQEGYSEKSGNAILAGMGALQSLYEQGMTVDGLYHQDYVTEDQKDQINLALRYLWETLPENAKTFLKYKSGSTGSNENAFALMSNLLFSRNTIRREATQTLVKNPTKEDGESDGTKGDQANPYFNIAKMIGGVETPISINKGTSYQYEIVGTNYSSLPGLDKKPVGATSVDDLLNQGLAGIVTDRNAISFGDQVVKSGDLENIMYDNSGGTMAILPCKVVGGRKVVDFAILDDYEAAQKEINELPPMSDAERAQAISRIFVEHDLMQLLDPVTGAPNKERFYQFLIIDAYGIDKNKFIQDSDFVQEVKNPTPELVDKIQRALSTDSNKSNYKIDVNNWYDINGHDRIYQASMYIPITNNELQMLTAFDGHATKYYQREQDYQNMQKRIGAKPASSSML